MSNPPRIPILLCFFLFLSKAASCQFYNAIDWGAYFNDNAHYPNFDYQQDDIINQIALDEKGLQYIYVVGKTFAPSIQSLSVCSDSQTIDLGYGNGYLAKYNQCGDLIWSTYIGDGLQCMALDQEEGKTIIYVGGKSNPGHAFSCDDSPEPVFQANNAGGSHGLIAKYMDDDTTPKLLRWTYFGGSGSGGMDNIYAMDIYNHHVFITGLTQSNNLFEGAQKMGDSIYGGNGDSFIGEFDSLLSKLMFFTYIGGEGNDRCRGINVFDSGHDRIEVFVSGTTSSTNDIASGSGFDLTYNGNNDAFLTRWDDKDNNGILSKAWGTYIGGAKYEKSRGTTVDKKGNIFLTGFTGSEDLPVSQFAYDKQFGISGDFNTGQDAYIVKVSNSGSEIWCTYFGGNANEEAQGLAFLRNLSGRYVIISGFTRSVSENFDLVNPIQSYLNGNDSNEYYDAFIAILNDVDTSQQQLIFSTYLGGSNDERVGEGLSFPSVFVGKRNELYYAGVTRSDDIDQVVGSACQNIVNTYNGGVDGFVAKLIDLSDPHQFNCSAFKIINNEPLNNEEYDQVRIIPNPCLDKFTAEINSECVGRTEIEIYNSYAQHILRREIDLHHGINQIPIDLKIFPSGIYMMSIVQNKKVLLSKVLKL